MRERETETVSEREKERMREREKEGRKEEGGVAVKSIRLWSRDGEQE